jgi:hypothetical protein
VSVPFYLLKQSANLHDSSGNPISHFLAAVSVGSNDDDDDDNNNNKLLLWWHCSPMAN